MATPAAMAPSPTRPLSSRFSSVSVTSVLDAANHYEVLGLPKTPGRKLNKPKVSGAFKRASLAVHPDKSDDVDAEDAFMKLHEAYRILSDPKLRAAYDDFLQGKRPGPEVAMGAPAASRTPPSRFEARTKPMANKAKLRREARARQQRDEAAREKARQVERQREDARSERLAGERERLEAEHREQAHARQQQEEQQRSRTAPDNRAQRRAASMAFLESISRKTPALQPQQSGKAAPGHAHNRVPTGASPMGKRSGPPSPQRVANASAAPNTTPRATPRRGAPGGSPTRGSATSKRWPKEQRVYMATAPSASNATPQEPPSPQPQPQASSQQPQASSPPPRPSPLDLTPMVTALFWSSSPAAAPTASPAISANPDVLLPSCQGGFEGPSAAAHAPAGTPGPRSSPSRVASRAGARPNLVARRAATAAAGYASSPTVASLPSTPPPGSSGGERGTDGGRPSPDSFRGGRSVAGSISNRRLGRQAERQRALQAQHQGRTTAAGAPHAAPFSPQTATLLAPSAADRAADGGGTGRSVAADEGFLGTLVRTVFVDGPARTIQ
jgi:curved DNA-binding protein CbpA